MEEIIPTRNSIVHACTTHAANTMHASECNLHALDRKHLAGILVGGARRYGPTCT